MAWLQLERHKVSFEDGLIRGAILLILHMIDYLKYKFTGKNVGPCGLSEYVQIKPIHIPTKPGDILDGLGDFFTLDERMSSQTKTPDGNRDKKSFIARINDERQNQKELRLPIFSINDSNHIG